MNYFANESVTLEVLVHPSAEAVGDDHGSNENDCDTDNDFDKHGEPLRVVVGTKYRKRYRTGAPRIAKLLSTLRLGKEDPNTLAGMASTL